jgi:hypothetical protein
MLEIYDQYSTPVHSPSFTEHLETKALPTHALLQHEVLFLEILDHVLDPTGERQKEHLKRQKQRNIAAEYIGPSDALPHSAAPQYLK